MDPIYVSLIKMISVLAIIVFGLVVTYRYARRLKIPSLGIRENPYGLKKTGTLHLGFRSFVTVVEVADHVLVLGNSEKELRLLAKWKREDRDV
jgi:flagellar biogenesis protein FliO